MSRTAAIALLLLAAGIATVVYKFLAADEHERSCGLTNIFRWDYSDEIRKGIRVVKNGSDIAIDFTNLKRWNRICLASMYEDDFYPIPTIDGRSAYPDISYRTGKWQCGGVDRMITIVLLGADGGGLARKFFLPPELKRDVWIHYESYTPMQGFSQCIDIANAISRCVEMPGMKPDRCMLMFPNRTQR